MKVATTYHEHDGGTKFYETVLLMAPDGKSMLVKRWGALRNLSKGGQTKVERGDYSSMLRERDRIVSEKMRPTTNKGHYASSNALTGRGFHAMSATGTHSLSDVLKVSDKHYDAEVAVAIKDYFIASDDSIVRSAFNKSPVRKELEPEIDRGAVWGSF